MPKNKQRKKKFKKSFNSFNGLFTPKQFLEIKGKSLIDNGVDCGFDFMDTPEFQKITEELRGKFNVK
tara:strand:+ start:174 stop:374 length:201 start_codon:yes stop_codon:yes gene_type:complete